jgi:hypothetical protein
MSRGPALNLAPARGRNGPGAPAAGRPRLSNPANLGNQAVLRRLPARLEPAVTLSPSAPVLQRDGAQPQQQGAGPPPRMSSAAFWGAYQQIGYNKWRGEEQRHDVWKFVGGAIGQAFDGQNTCATRVSYALDYGGAPIAGFDQKTSFRNWSNIVFEGKAGDDKNYIVGAPQMSDYFTKKMGAPDARLTTGDEGRAFEKTLASGQCAVFAGDHHSGLIKDSGYSDPYVKGDPSVLPVNAWKLA